MSNFNYFFTSVGPEYKKKFARNVGIAVLILFAFYGIWNIVADTQDQKQTEEWRETRESVLSPMLEKQLDAIEPSKSNTVIIYSIKEHNSDRVFTEPHDITIFLERDDVVTWINHVDHMAVVYDLEGGTWSTGEIPPLMQKSVQFNKTGFYDYAVDAGDRHHGEIVAISNETNSLPIEIRMKMGMSMVSGDRDNNPALVGVGTGATEKGVTITINEEELKRLEDAESFYYNMYRNLIPFDVPITIEFGEPARLLTG